MVRLKSTGPVFSKLFRLDRTDPLSFGPKFPEFLVEWIAAFAPSKNHWSHRFQITLTDIELHMTKLTFNLGGCAYIVCKERPFLKSEPEETGTYYDMRKVVCDILYRDEKSTE